jgi:hypothetical protein
MRTPNLSSPFFLPTPPPIPMTDEGRVLLNYFTSQVEALANMVKLVAEGHLDPLSEAPDKPRDGDIRYADGTTWNPGSGRGLYLRKQTSWVFIA